MMVRKFLKEKVAELGVKREAKHLMTTPKEIAKNTGLDVRVVKKHLLEMAHTENCLSRAQSTPRENEEKNVVITRVGKTDVVLVLSGNVDATESIKITKEQKRLLDELKVRPQQPDHEVIQFLLDPLTIPAFSEEERKLFFGKIKKLRSIVR